jgi:hypothetical protein
MKRNENCRLQIANCRLPSFPRSAWERTVCDALRRLVRRGASGKAGSHAERGNQTRGNGKFSIFNLQFAIALLLFASPSFAQQLQRPKIVGVRVGIADRYKAGLWTQVVVTLRGGSETLTGEVSVIVPDGDGVPGRASKPCQVLPGQDSTVRLISRFGRVDGDLTAEFRVGRDLIADKRFETGMQADGDRFLPALESQNLVVLVGDSTLGMDEVGKLSGAEADFRPVAARVDDIERLPIHWCGYEGVHAVVLSTSRPEIYRKLAANNARVQALDQWVRMGGRLVLCVGAQADEILAPNSPLGQFAPGRLKEMVSLHQTGALETYCGSRLAVSPPGGGKLSMRVPRLADVQGVVEAAESDLPLVVRTARGFGQVIFAAADLDQLPLGNWSDRPRLVAKLLDLPTDRAQEANGNAAMMHYGYSDLAGQMRSALDRFTGVRQAPFWLVAGLIVIYILLIGPGDYFFLRKVVRRMEWTWLTFPLIVAVVSLGAYVLAYWLKGDQLRVHQVDLVDVDAASGRVRGTAWMNVFSPRMEAFNLTVRPRQFDGQPAADARVWMAWLGLPGGAIGGMNSHASGPLLWTDEFRYAPDLDAMSKVPIQVWSTKSLTARWEATNDVCPAAELTEAEQFLSGSITNTLPFPLRRCVLAHGRSAYELGTLQPGQSVFLGPTTKRTELATLLTGRRAVFTEGDKSQQEVTAYDQSSTDLAYILRMMMFYEKAGGRRYTGLWNAYQGFVDLSTLLKTDRAILVAEGSATSGEDRQGAELLRDGRPLGNSQDQHITLYRFVFPVKKEK